MFIEQTISNLTDENDEELYEKYDENIIQLADFIHVHKYFDMQYSFKVPKITLKQFKNIIEHIELIDDYLNIYEYNDDDDLEYLSYQDTYCVVCSEDGDIVIKNKLTIEFENNILPYNESLQLPEYLKSYAYDPEIYTDEIMGLGLNLEDKTQENFARLLGYKYCFFENDFYILSNND